MIYLGILLHAYQPWTQREDIRQKIFYESYWPIVALANSYPTFAFSTDIARSLGERLPNWFLEYIQNTYQRKKIELLNTSAYHYLLPLHDINTIRQQLLINEEFYRENFIANDPLPGVFLPELAFSPKIAEYSPLYNFSWCLADELSYTYKRAHLTEYERMPINWIPRCGPTGVLLRSSYWSNKVAFRQYHSAETFFEELLNGQKDWRSRAGVNGDSYIIIALDMETFGHHQKDGVVSFFMPFLAKTLERDDAIAITPLNEIFEKFPKIHHTQFFTPASWSTEKEHLDQKIPYPIWDHPANHFHRLWNEFARYAPSLAKLEHGQKTELNELLKKAFYSCSPWQYANGNKEAAAWCIPSFRRIAEMLGNDKKLLGIIQEMEDLLIE